MGRKFRLWHGMLGLLLATGLYAAYLLATNNFHTVIPGELYRSGQVFEGDITSYARQYGIRSVINLRGANAGSPWYDEEVKESNEAGIRHIDFPVSTKREMTPEQAEQLIATMRAAPKPLLIHCNGGANRTGLAAALYLAAITKADEDTAEQELTFLYGNFPRWLGSKSRMSESFERLKPMLGYTQP